MIKFITLIALAGLWTTSPAAILLMTSWLNFLIGIFFLFQFANHYLKFSSAKFTFPQSFFPKSIKFFSLPTRSWVCQKITPLNSEKHNLKKPKSHSRGFLLFQEIVKKGESSGALAKKWKKKRSRKRKNRRKSRKSPERIIEVQRFWRICNGAQRNAREYPEKCWRGRRHF